MHVDDERIQRLVHGELEPDAAAELQGHLAECIECQARAAAAEQEENQVSAWLAQLDRDPVQVGAADVISAAGVRAPTAWRWAAGILLALGAAGGAYAASGWVMSNIAGSESPPEEAVVERPPGVREDATAGGIRVEPGQNVLIVFAARQTSGRAMVRLVDDAEVEIGAAGAAAAFTLGADSILIDNAGSTSDFSVLIPRDAPRVEIRVADRVVFLKEGPRVSTGALRDTLGAYLIPLHSTN